MLCGTLVSGVPAVNQISAATDVTQAKVAEQTIKVKGVVKDAAGPVIGATVVEKGTPNNGTVTDIDGNFTLTVKSGATLVISYVGMKVLR